MTLRSTPQSRGPGAGRLLTTAVVVSCLGAFVCSLDSALNVAFPDLTRRFALTPRSLTLIIVLYHVPIGALTLAGGIAGDRFGHARLFTAGVVASTIAFALCGLAPTYDWLLLARLVQGAGAGLVFGTSPALITLAVAPEARGPGIGALGLAAGVGAAIGPLIGGVLMERWAWPSVFLFRVPLALGVLVIALARLRQPGRRSATARRAWRLPRLSGALIGADLMAVAANAAFIVLYILGPLYLDQVLGCPAALAGVLFTMVPLGMAVGGFASGWCTRRFAPGSLVIAGLAVEALGLALVGAMGGAPSTARTAVGFVLSGLGLGAFQVPNIARVMALVPDTAQGFGGGMIAAMRTVGVITGAALAPRLLELREAAHRVHGRPPGAPSLFAAGFDDVLLAATAVAAFALAVALWRPRGSAR